MKTSSILNHQKLSKTSCILERKKYKKIENKSLFSKNKTKKNMKENPNQFEFLVNNSHRDYW